MLNCWIFDISMVEVWSYYSVCISPWRAGENHVESEIAPILPPLFVAEMAEWKLDYPIQIKTIHTVYFLVRRGKVLYTNLYSKFSASAFRQQFCFVVILFNILGISGQTFVFYHSTFIVMKKPEQPYFRSSAEDMEVAAQEARRPKFSLLLGLSSHCDLGNTEEILYTCDNIGQYLGLPFRLQALFLRLSSTHCGAPVLSSRTSWPLWISVATALGAKFF